MNESGMDHIHGVDIYDIYDIVYEQWWKSPWVWIPASIAVCVLLVGTWLIYKKRKNKVVLSYEQRVRQQLTTLKNLAPEDATAFYSTLTNLAKEYISQMYGVSAQGLTDDEVVQLLKTSAALPKAVIDEAMKIFEGTAIVKFARGTALKDAMNGALESMYAILEQTKKRD